MIILTAGKTYLDIDGYASIIAYREFLSLIGIPSKFVSDAMVNYSVTESLKKLPFSVDNYAAKPDDKYIILDLSNPTYFPDFVNKDNIIEIIDHHPGYEEYWNNILKDKSIIEPVGAVATIIFEKYEQVGLLNKMNKDVALLLMAAILDNTLNFTANITSKRDKDAYLKLESISGKLDFAQEYFSECQLFIENNLDEAISNDIKIQKVNKYLPDVFGQLTIWSFDELLNKVESIKKIMNKYGDKWMINIISLKDNISYIICSNEDVLNNINYLFASSVDDNMIIIKPAILRKEIMKIAIDKEEI